MISKSKTSFLMEFIYFLNYDNRINLASLHFFNFNPLMLDANILYTTLNTVTFINFKRQ